MHNAKGVSRIFECIRNLSRVHVKAHTKITMVRCYDKQKAENANRKRSEFHTRNFGYDLFYFSKRLPLILLAVSVLIYEHPYRVLKINRNELQEWREHR